MSFNFKLAVFPQSKEDHKRIRGDRFDPSKKYPEFSGVLNIPANQ